MHARLYIAIPFHNRKLIVEQCLPTIATTKTAADYLDCWDDGSAEYPAEFLQGLGADCVHHTEIARGIEPQRKAHLGAFWEHRNAFTHLYLTDSDALHDPNWRSQALGLQADNNGAPVCLYNTEAHARMQGNTLEDDITKNVIWRYYAPGISYLLSRDHVEAVMPWVLQLQNWDWDVPRILGHRMCISRTSYVDHLGLGGMHHPPTEGLDGGDRALNPTPWLVAKRAEAVAELSK